MTTVVAPDPLQAAVGGRYDDDCVLVVRSGPPGLSAARMADGRVLLQHRLPYLDDDVAEALAAALAPVTTDHEVFAHAFTGLVLTTHADPLRSWELFYRASLARLDDPARRGYVDVHRHALTLLRYPSVLDAGCSFGFLALHLARRGVDVTTWEPQPGTARLLHTMSVRLGLPLTSADGLDEIGDRSVDAVALLHVLEHVDEATGAELLRESMRVARHRVVVAVPYEDVPNALYGHVRRMDAPNLARLGAATAWQATVYDHHGGWLVLDRPAARSSSHPHGWLLSNEGDQQ